MELNNEIRTKAKSAKTPEELIEIAKENDVEMTEESAKAYFDLLHPKTGEMSDDELDNVSGGGGSGDEPLFAVGQWVYVRATNAAALILENLGKQGSIFPEFKYKIEVNDTGHFIVEKWESELKKSYRGDE